MVYSLMYRRPAHVSINSLRSPTPTSSDGSVKSGVSGCLYGIPDALSFDKILKDGTCPPVTLRDFMNYLIYVEHSAENLQFYLWVRDYTTRFLTTNTSDLALAPAWTQGQQDAAVASATAQKRTKAGIAVEIFKGTDFEETRSKAAGQEIKDPFTTPPFTPTENSTERALSLPWDQYESKEQLNNYATSSVSSYAQQAADAFEAAGLKRPFTIQPFREEVDRVIATYIRDKAPRWLNLSDRERTSLLQALQYTTHPTAFLHVAKSIETTLRRQSHPNFIRWTICNGNRSRVIFARGLGIAVILLGILSAVIITLSSAHRGFRTISAVLWFIGTATLFAGWKGMCVVLHGMHHRHLRPWELFEENDGGDNVEMSKTSFETFDSSNSYEDAPWVKKYEKRNIVRKVFDREVWIQEPALRQIQDTIFLQAVLTAAGVALLLSAIFVAIPKGALF